MLLLDEQEEVVGTGRIYCIDHKNAELRKMYLLAEHRGKVFLTTLLDKARSLGYERAELGQQVFLKKKLLDCMKTLDLKCLIQIILLSVATKLMN